MKLSTPKISKRIAALALAVMAPIAAVAVDVAPASAASQTTACFKWSNGAAYASQPVYLMQWNGAQWVSIRNGRTNTNGCGTFYNVPTNQYITMKGYAAFGNGNIGMALWEGFAPRYANPGQGGVNLGTGRVNLVKCVPGLYGYCAGF